MNRAQTETSSIACTYLTSCIRSPFPEECTLDQVIGA
uniref:Uncharacterized protein n=1 Tax=Arundo donax TaxID=35708 RepID=A0A0A9ELH0_ARUDO